MYLLGCLIDISHTTQFKLNSWNSPQKISLTAFAISVLVAQAKNTGFILDASIYLTPLMLLVRKPFWFYVVDAVIYHLDPPQDKKIYFPSCYEWCWQTILTYQPSSRFVSTDRVMLRKVTHSLAPTLDDITGPCLPVSELPIQLYKAFLTLYPGHCSK